MHDPRECRNARSPSRSGHKPQQPQKHDRPSLTSQIRRLKLAADIEASQALLETWGDLEPWCRACSCRLPLARHLRAAGSIKPDTSS